MTSKKRKLPDWMNVCKIKEDSTSGVKSEESVADMWKDNTTAPDGDTSSPRKNKEARRAEASAEFNKLMEQSLPEIKFKGNLTYCYEKKDCCLMCELIEFSFSESLPGETCDNTCSEVFMGFDMEWPVTYQPGKQDKTALIQLCTGSDCCYLFQLSSMGCVPKPLKNLLENHNIKKVGVGIESDFWKLEKDFGIKALPIIRNGIVDLSHFANKVLRSSENWSLEGLTRQLFKSKINKDSAVRKSDWSRCPLSDKQREYAATDAFVCFKIYDKLKSMQK